MREALEQVKGELGEDALVLDTKRVLAGGIFGLGAREQIEVRVAADATASASPRDEARQTRRESSRSILNLTEDAPATPAQQSARSERTNAPAFAALAARAYTGDSNNRPTTTTAQNTPDSIVTTTRGVELAETAPRVVHRQPAAEQPINVSTPASTSALQADASSLPQRNTLSTDIERLRAELREVKFSLGTLAARSIAPGNNAPDPLAAFDTDPEIYDSPSYETYLELTATGLAPDLARRAVRFALSTQPGDARHACEIGRDGLASVLPSMVRFAEDPFQAATQQDVSKPRAGIVFIGPTGVGKTTTIAKLAARVALGARRRVVLITLDTYRIAAVEQLKTYAEIIGAACHVARSVVELDALARRHADEATVLIDTIGRSPHDLAGEMELADYLRSSEDLLKCLVLQATTHPTDALAAVKKFGLYGANRLAITKLDETARPGAAVSVASDAALPLLYLCAGQRVPSDLELATPETFAARVVRAKTNAAAA